MTEQARPRSGKVWRCYVQWETQDGRKHVERSRPVTYDDAHRYVAERVARGDHAWVEDEEACQ